MDPSCGIYFPKEERVLALYPETTTFYGANIITSAKRRKTGDYMVLFDEVCSARATHLFPLAYAVISTSLQPAGLMQGGARCRRRTRKPSTTCMSYNTHSRRIDAGWTGGNEIGLADFRTKSLFQ